MVLRHQCDDDAENLARHLFSEQVIAFWDEEDSPFPKEHLTVEETKSTLSWMGTLTYFDAIWLWVIELDSEPIGTATVRFDDLPEALEHFVCKESFAKNLENAGQDDGIYSGKLGCYVSPYYKGQGIEALALRTLMAHLREVRPELPLWANALAADTDFRNVLEQSGMEFKLLREKSKEPFGLPSADVVYYMRPLTPAGE